MSDKTDVELLRGSTFSEDLVVVKHSRVQDAYPIHTHDFYEFFLVTRGRALHVVNSTTHIIERGSLVLMRPRDVHFYDSHNLKQFVLYNVGIGVNVFQRVNDYYGGALTPIDQSDLPKHILLDDDTTAQIERLLVSLGDMKADGNGSALYFMLLATVGYYVLTGEEQKVQDYIPDWLFHLLEDMENPGNYTVGLPRLLQLANYSQEYVNRAFRRYLKTTPTRFINEKRLALARGLLASTDMPIAAISEECGFSSVSYFYEQYKNKYGITPGSETRGLTRR